MVIYLMRIIRLSRPGQGMTKDLAPKHRESSGGQSPKSSNPGEQIGRSGGVEVRESSGVRV